MQEGNVIFVRKGVGADGDSCGAMEQLGTLIGSLWSLHHSAYLQCTAGARLEIMLWSKLNAVLPGGLCEHPPSPF